MYFAGMGRHVTVLNTAVEYGCQHLMLSYYYDRFISSLQMSRFRKYGLHIMLDSGAYTAWKKGLEINIDEYIDFIKANNIGKYIALDVVGDPITSHINLKYMESKGLHPIPVFHLGSDIEFLRQLVEREKYPYICLGGTVGSSKAIRDNFFSECFSTFPKTRFHALGMTDTSLMAKYPWSSIDSTSWLMVRVNGLLQTADRRIRLPRNMSDQEKLGLNVKFYCDFVKML